MSNRDINTLSAPGRIESNTADGQTVGVYRDPNGMLRRFILGAPLPAEPLGIWKGARLLSVYVSSVRGWVSILRGRGAGTLVPSYVVEKTSASYDTAWIVCEVAMAIQQAQEADAAALEADVLPEARFCTTCAASPAGEGPCPYAAEISGVSQDCSCCTTCRANCADEV